MKKSRLVYPLFLLFLSSCASINSVSLTPIPAERSNQVKTQKSKLIFLAFNFDNDFVDETVEDLKRQCPQGKISGLLTKDENINYFLFFVWKKQITATGFCVPVASLGNNKKRVSGSVNQKGNQNFESELF